ncbi:hypothetical protein [Eubacterium sp.]
MKKKILAVSMCAIMTLTNAVGVFASNYCGGSVVFQNSNHTVLATTYCSYSEGHDDYTVIVEYSATRRSDGKVFTGGNSSTGKSTVQSNRTINGYWKKAIGTHTVYYRDHVNWNYTSSNQA